jgi:hypothetical protein
MNRRHDGDARTLKDDLARLEEGFTNATRGAERRLRDAVAEQPLLALGAAAAFGFLLGRGLPRGAGAVLAGAGVRLASAWLEQEFLGRAPQAQENE